MELKKALTYEEQVDRLEKVHNLTIDSKEDAISILSRINYYRLSAYGIGLKKKDDPEKYADGISLKTLYRLYVFRQQIQKYPVSYGRAYRNTVQNSNG